jgi:uncharacterized protein involved in cysteine biosynthesis
MLGAMNYDMHDSKRIVRQPETQAVAAIGLLTFLALTVPFLGLVLIPVVAAVTWGRALVRSAPRSAF